MELLTMEEGYRESTTAAAEVLRTLKERGLSKDPLMEAAVAASWTAS